VGVALAVLLSFGQGREWWNRLENERKLSAGWSGAAAVKGEENSQPGAATLEKKMGLGLGIFCIFS